MNPAYTARNIALSGLLLISGCSAQEPVERHGTQSTGLQGRVGIGIYCGKAGEATPNLVRDANDAALADLERQLGRDLKSAEVNRYGNSLLPEQVSWLQTSYPGHFTLVEDSSPVNVDGTACYGIMIGKRVPQDDLSRSIGQIVRQRLQGKISYLQP
ncbi:hypothetical protein COV20_00730 [Candidatus Woesearchaeota archaeon CG10_big_fil_rev_8_21_14_0_10_45_16]|nr:MAG: hypothetical protein COV20_00730 [Candidatus Woesearchaeota archaeon CG10_big_fil_rev_8_21_14_0_10_45_16]